VQAMNQLLYVMLVMTTLIKMPPLEFNKVLDRYLIENLISSEEYELLDDSQKFVIQTLKKAFKRIKSKQNNEI